MPRESLHKFYHKKQNVPRTYTGRLDDVSIFWHRSGYRALVSDVTLTSGEWITDHVWLKLEVMPQTLGLNIGDRIQYTGIVTDYHRRNGRLDYGIVATQESLTKEPEVN